MNFQEKYKDELLLEDVWGTPGEDGTGVWKKNINRDEFRKVDEPDLQEIVMYFSLEEFVLTRKLKQSESLGPCLLLLMPLQKSNGFCEIS